MVAPAADPAAGESVPAVPDSAVFPVIGAGVDNWLLTAVPVMLALTGGAGVPKTVGLVPKSLGLRPPAATIDLGAPVGLACVTGTVGRVAAYWLAAVACAGMKLFCNFMTVGTLPLVLPVLGSHA